LNLVELTEFGDISNYQPNGEFDLLTFESVRHEQYYSCCPEPYPDITYTLKLRRRPLFYVFNLILPCILINSIALLVFYVPSESGEKVTLGISALLSMTVFLMTIRESLPPTEKTPLISLYYGVSICLVSFASGMAVVTLNIHHRGLRGIAIPELLKTYMLGYVANFLFLKLSINDPLEIAETARPDHSHSSKNMSSFTSLDCTNSFQFRKKKSRIGHKCSSAIQIISTNGELPSFCSCSNNPENFSNYEVDTGRVHMGVKLDAQGTEKFCNLDMRMGGIPVASPRFGPRLKHTHLGHSDSFEIRASNLLLRVATTVERSERRVEYQERRESLTLEWKKLALVCDRCLLIIFFLTTGIATSAILLSSPHGP
ncbi:hypothetical protein QYM36_009667, partial [Artemia franciscana]